MKTIAPLLWLMLGTELTGAYGQSKPNPLTMNTQANLNQLNATVKAAYTSWQAGDAKTWLSFFAADAVLYDDGNPRDFHRFIAEACGHERFTSLDQVEDEGRSIYGPFHSDRWGNFRTYFKFHLNSVGKFDRLEIGQAN